MASHRARGQRGRPHQARRKRRLVSWSRAQLLLCWAKLTTASLPDEKPLPTVLRWPGMVADRLSSVLQEHEVACQPGTEFELSTCFSGTGTAELGVKMVEAALHRRGHQLRLFSPGWAIDREKGPQAVLAPSDLCSHLGGDLLDVWPPEVLAHARAL